MAAPQQNLGLPFLRALGRVLYQLFSPVWWKSPALLLVLGLLVISVIEQVTNCSPTHPTHAICPSALNPCSAGRL